MSNAPQFIAHIRDLISKDKIDTAIQELKKLLEGSPRLTEVLQQSARYHRIITEQRLGVVDAAIANLEQNKISLGLLELLDLIAEEYSLKPKIKAEVEQYTQKNVVNQSSIHAGQNAIIGDGNTINYFTNGDVPQNKSANNRKLLKIGAAIVAIIGLVASVAQISGYSLKDFFSKEQTSTTVEKPTIEEQKNKELDNSPTKEKPSVAIPKVENAKPSIKNQTNIKVKKGGKVGTVITGDSNKIVIKQGF